MINSPHVTEARNDRVHRVNRAALTAAVLASAIFVADVATPLGAGAAMLSVIPLLVGVLAGPPRFLLVAAASFRP